MDNLDKILDSVQAEEQKALEEQQAAAAEEQRLIDAGFREHEAKTRIEKAIEEDDLQKLTQAIVEEQHKGYLPEDYLQTIPEKNLWIAGEVKSAEMTDFLLSQIDTKTEKGKEFAEGVIHNMIVYMNQPVEDMIEMANKYNVSMQKTLNYHDKDIVLKCLEAGANPQDFDFSGGVRVYYNCKNGYTQSNQYSDVDIDPDPKGAAKQKEILIAVLKAGYKIDVEKLKASTKDEDKIVYQFLSEIAREREAERKFTTLNDEDKKLVAKMTAETNYITAYDVDKIRKMIGDKMMKQQVYDYMKLLPEEGRGAFFNYYGKLMEKSHQAAANGTLAADDTLPKSLDEAEIKLVKESRNGHDIYSSKILDMSPRCEEDIKNKLGEIFFNDLYLNRFIGTDGSMKEHLEDFLGKKLLAEYVAEHLEEKMKVIEPDSDKKKFGYLESIMALDMENKDEQSGQKLRMALLKYRASGSNAQRRKKAGMFADALSYFGYSPKLKHTENTLAYYDKLTPEQAKDHDKLRKVSYTGELNRYIKKKERGE